MLQAVANELPCFTSKSQQPETEPGVSGVPVNFAFNKKIFFEF